MKVKRITLEYDREGWVKPGGDSPHHYRVKSLGDSVDYAPGDLLRKAEVDGLCRQHTWRVSIIHPTQESAS